MTASEESDPLLAACLHQVQMNFVIIPRQKSPIAGSDGNLLRWVLQSQTIAQIVCDGLVRTKLPNLCAGTVVCAIPEEWGVRPRIAQAEVIVTRENVSLPPNILRGLKRKAWVVFSNGWFATRINEELLGKALSETQSQVLMVDAKPDLLAYREKVRLTADGKVAGFRRVYADTMEPVPLPTDWPHHTFVRSDVLGRLLPAQTIPGSFPAFLQACRSAKLETSAVGIAGAVYDLQTEAGLLNLCSARLQKMRNSKFRLPSGGAISPGSRLVGKVLWGKNVQIGPNAIVVGPAIIGSEAKIEQGAVINSSIICDSVRVRENEFIQNRIVTVLNQEQLTGDGKRDSRYFFHQNVDINGRQAFRIWPLFSYARTLKRVADILAAAIVLILFAPVTPFIALAIELTSPGPVFFKDKRQGLHGKAFNCLKFRTMQVGAGEIQEKLRVISQVDGPQFKIADDPRISIVGRFLRDTFLDEIPQFVNVLLGQMSVIGPRPSPESENTLCPWWRDARLSVRPGITGLWQVCRTRQPGKDFQEWIHYDTEYVRNLSLRMDLWVCWQTVKKMAHDFVRQFY